MSTIQFISFEKAYKIAKEYCLKKGLSVEKLDKQAYSKMYSPEDGAIGGFSQPTDIVHNGLCNDLATRPYPTLIIREDGTVEETEFTKKYLV